MAAGIDTRWSSAPLIRRDALGLPSAGWRGDANPWATALVVLGSYFAIGPALWSADAGHQTPPPRAAWAAGAAQPIVIAGIVLVALTTFLYRGARWPRWPIVAWCPLSIVATALWYAMQGLAALDPGRLALEGLPVVLFWIWATRRALFGGARPG